MQTRYLKRYPLYIEPFWQLFCLLWWLACAARRWLIRPSPLKWGCLEGRMQSVEIQGGAEQEHQRLYPLGEGLAAHSMAGGPLQPAARICARKRGRGFQPYRYWSYDGHHRSAWLRAQVETPASAVEPVCEY
ncbi:MAG: hypothetical protein QM581_05410 [Pseudomonas sp.]